jgi:hypothetical protein
MSRWLLVGFALSLGCASAPKPDPLSATATALSLAALAITASSKGTEAQIAADYRERLRACPEAPDDRERCRALAREQALAPYRARVAVLAQATELQHRAAQAAESADLCRRQGAACEEAKAREARALLDDLSALLGRIEGAP